MVLILYAPVESSKEEEILSHVGGSAPIHEVIVCRTTDKLFESLLRPLCDVLAVIVMIQDRKDLERMLHLQDLLHEVRVILLLFDPEKDTLEEAQVLRPRLLTYAESDPRNIAAVIQKMASDSTCWDRR